MGKGILLSKLAQAKVIATRTVQGCNTNKTNKLNSIKMLIFFYFFPLTHFIDCIYHSDVTQKRPNLSHTAPNSVQKTEKYVHQMEFWKNFNCLMLMAYASLQNTKDKVG